MKLIYYRIKCFRNEEEFTAGKGIWMDIMRYAENVQEMYGDICVYI